MDEELLRVQRSLASADEMERCLLEQRSLGSVRNREQRWDLKLPLSPCVSEALKEVVQHLQPMLQGTMNARDMLLYVRRVGCVLRNKSTM